MTCFCCQGSERASSVGHTALVCGNCADALSHCWQVDMTGVDESLTSERTGGGDCFCTSYNGTWILFNEELHRNQFGSGCIADSRTRAQRTWTRYQLVVGLEGPGSTVTATCDGTGVASWGGSIPGDGTFTGGGTSPGDCGFPTEITASWSGITVPSVSGDTVESCDCSSYTGGFSFTTESPYGSFFHNANPRKWYLTVSSTSADAFLLYEGNISARYSSDDFDFGGGTLTLVGTPENCTVPDGISATRNSTTSFTIDATGIVGDEVCEEANGSFGLLASTRLYFQDTRPADPKFTLNLNGDTVTLGARCFTGAGSTPAVWSLPIEDFDCDGTNSLPLSSTNGCDGWPSSVTVKPVSCKQCEFCDDVNPSQINVSMTVGATDSTHCADCTSLSTTFECFPSPAKIGKLQEGQSPCVFRSAIQDGVKIFTRTANDVDVYDTNLWRLFHDTGAGDATAVARVSGGIDLATFTADSFDSDGTNSFEYVEGSGFEETTVIVSDFLLESTGADDTSYNGNFTLTEHRGCEQTGVYGQVDLREETFTVFDGLGNVVVAFDLNFTDEPDKTTVKCQENSPTLAGFGFDTTMCDWPNTVSLSFL